MYRVGSGSGNLGELEAPVRAQIGTAYLKDENSYVRSEDAYVEMRARKVDCELRVPHFSVAPCPSFFWSRLVPQFSVAPCPSFLHQCILS